jgi:hypothetical protein
VKEQSHKQEMSAAIRGDFQRLRARGVAAALVPQEHPEARDDEELPARAEHPANEEPAPPARDVESDEFGWLRRLLGP